MQYVFNEPEEYGFQDRDGHDGKFFGTQSQITNHMIIECADRLTVRLKENKSEFSYYIIEGEGFFEIKDEKLFVKASDLVVIPPGTIYSFGGHLKMLLINTPHWSKDQEEVLPLEG